MKLGFGVGIIAQLAHTLDENQELLVRDMSDFFPVSVTRIAYMKDKHLKNYLTDIVGMLESHGEKLNKQLQDS